MSIKEHKDLPMNETKIPRLVQKAEEMVGRLKDAKGVSRNDIKLIEAMMKRLEWQRDRLAIYEEALNISPEDSIPQVEEQVKKIYKAPFSYAVSS